MTEDERMSDIVSLLRFGRCYVRGPGTIGYDDRGEHLTLDGKPIGDVEAERREAADTIEALRTAVGELVSGLSFYANEWTYSTATESADGGEGHHPTEALCNDHGERARALLAKYGER